MASRKAGKKGWTVFQKERTSPELKIEEYLILWNSRKLQAYQEKLLQSPVYLKISRNNLLSTGPYLSMRENNNMVLFPEYKKAKEQHKNHNMPRRSDLNQARNVIKEFEHPSIQEDDEDEDKNLELGPMIALKEQLEKDKDHESLRRWKEQLLGIVDLEEVGETPDPVVKIMNLTIRSPDREDMVPWFTLKEGSKYTLVFIFRVTNNIVSGLRYSNTVWKTGIKVYSRKQMLGTFSPQAEPYNHVMFEESTPSGMLVRGSYSVKSKLLDRKKNRREHLKDIVHFKNNECFKCILGHCTIKFILLMWKSVDTNLVNRDIFLYLDKTSIKKVDIILKDIKLIPTFSQTRTKPNFNMKKTYKFQTLFSTLIFLLFLLTLLLSISRIDAVSSGGGCQHPSSQNSCKTCIADEIRMP
ncbi:hypothetical protein YC2023_100731 [Brassica napus]